MSFPFDLPSKLLGIASKIRTGVIRYSLNPDYPFFAIEAWEDANNPGSISPELTLIAHKGLPGKDVGATSGMVLGQIFIRGADSTGTARNAFFLRAQAQENFVSTFGTLVSILMILNGQSTPTEIVQLSSGGSDETVLLLYDVSAGTLKRVSRGAGDSGGAGFRLLRIPN